MSDGESIPERVVTYTDNIGTPEYRFEYNPTDARVYPDPAKAPPPVRFEHDAMARVFRLTAPDESVEVFRDDPTRYLCPEPDPDGGGMRPVMKHGQPVHL